jgi:hypothetical protein
MNKVNWYGTKQFQWMNESKRQLEEAHQLENKCLRGLESRLEDMGLLEGINLRSLVFIDKNKAKSIYRFIKNF